MRIIAVDIGRSRVKLYSKGLLEEFLSVLGESRELTADYMLKKYDFVLTYQGKTYFAGNLAANESEMPIQDSRETKVHQSTKLLAVIAMHRVVNDGDEIFLVTCQPIKLHKKKNKEALQQLLLGEYTAILNGVKKSWHVRHVLVLPEDACAAWAIPDAPKYLHVIGSGSRTTNFAFLVNRGLIDKLSGTLDIGCETIQNMKADFFADSVCGSLSRRWLAQQGPVMLIGGKAAEFEDEFARYYTDVFVPDKPQFTTVLGAYEVGVKLFEQITQKA